MIRFQCWICGRFAYLLDWWQDYTETSNTVVWFCVKCGHQCDGS